MTIGVVGPDLMPTGAVIPYALNIAPPGYILCDGRPVSRDWYGKLFSVIGTTFGVGDGSTTFNVPDMRDRCVLGSGNLYDVGGSGGNKYITLSVGQLPAHHHTGTTDGGGWAQNTEGGPVNSLGGLSPYAATYGTHTHTFTSDNTGSGDQIDITPQYTSLWHIIKT